MSATLLFADSTHRLLSVPGTEIVANRFAHERRAFTADEVAATNDEYDHFVAPLANALRPDFTRPLTRLTAFIEQLSIPTTIVGIGAQLSLDDLDTAPGDELRADLARHQERAGLRDFVRRVRRRLRRSAR
jgi:hypothetical protein